MSPHASLLRLTAASVAGILTAALTVVPAQQQFTDIVLRGTDTGAAAAAVVAAGGEVEFEIELVDGVAARVPADAMAALAADPRVVDVSPDHGVTLSWEDDWEGEGNRAQQSSDTAADAEARTTARGIAPRDAALLLGARKLVGPDATGDGIDVAVIDSGVETVSGLEGAVTGRVDLSGDGELGDDGFGHGTAMASIIGHATHGIAPDAGIVDVRVAADNGVADVSQVLAAIDWVVANRGTDGRNIRVLSLSFGTDGAQHYTDSPLAFAVEAAWRAGIVVVVAAGNHGDDLGRLSVPAVDPYVIAVGAVDLRGTADRGDDVVPSFSAHGDGTRNPDVLAPGRSVLAAVPADSLAATQNADRFDGTFLPGSGTSQATAFTAGVVASVLDLYPRMDPDQVKEYLTDTAKPLAGVSRRVQGEGVLNMRRMETAELEEVLAGSRQRFPASQGDGSIDADRGNFKVENEQGELLSGESTVFGDYDGDSWTQSVLNGSTWTGSTWTGSTWTGSTWTGSTWTGSTWTGSTWTGSTWTGSTWTWSTWTTAAWE